MNEVYIVRYRDDIHSKSSTILHVSSNYGLALDYLNNCLIKNGETKVFEKDIKREVNYFTGEITENYWYLPHILPEYDSVCYEIFRYEVDSIER